MFPLPQSNSLPVLNKTLLRLWLAGRAPRLRFPIQTAFSRLTGDVTSPPVVADWIGVAGLRRAGCVHVTLGTNDCQDGRASWSFEELPLEIPTGYCGNTLKEDNGWGLAGMVEIRGSGGKLPARAPSEKKEAENT